MGSGSGSTGHAARSATRTRIAGRVTDCSEPYGLDSTLRTLSVDGVAGAEAVHVGDDRGRITRLTVEEGEPTVRGVAVPGPNEPITELRTADRLLFAADTTGRLHQSADGRERTAVVVGRNGGLLARGHDPGFQRVGVESPDGLYAVTLTPDGAVYAVGAEGSVVEGRTA